MSVSTDDFVMPDTNQQDADRRLVVRFHYEARIDAQATEREGREICKQVEFVTILIPGDKTLNITRRATPADRSRFPMQYQAFKNGAAEALTGTPLVGWPLITESQRKELEYFNIRTVESLANVADTFAGNMMGVQALKQTASKYLETAKSAAPAIKLQKELELRDSQISAMQDQINKLLERFSEPAAPAVTVEKGPKGK